MGRRKCSIPDGLSGEYMNKLIKGITDDGMSNILDLLILSFNNYYCCGSEHMHIDRNDFEISEVIYDNSDMINTYNKHFLYISYYHILLKKSIMGGCWILSD
mgnify:CR=1 FL=1